jgi:hypothetical protein
VQLHRPNVLFIQETMCPGDKSKEMVQSWLKEWSFFSLDSVGLSGGLLTAWSLLLKLCSLNYIPSSIVVKLQD